MEAMLVLLKSSEDWIAWAVLLDLSNVGKRGSWDLVHSPAHINNYIDGRVTGLKDYISLSNPRRLAPLGGPKTMRRHYPENARYN